jgi:hypothetical protein
MGRFLRTMRKNSPLSGEVENQIYHVEDRLKTIRKNRSLTYNDPPFLLGEKYFN